MRIAGCRASEVCERAALKTGNKPVSHNPLPTPLDSGLRRNDEVRGRNDEVRGRNDELWGGNDEVRGRNDELRSRNDECESGGMRARSGTRNTILEEITKARH